MCGIAGIIDVENSPVEGALLHAMNQSIVHRGPDDEGYVLIDQMTGRHVALAGPDSPSDIKSQLFPITSYCDTLRANIGLSHRRFSIIDLSSAGHQPFFDQDQSCCVVFNGEIYNYLEVREELSAKGIEFRTHSDTEVLLAAYKYWGPECFEKLNGFWAMALYDFLEKRLILSRDRIGKKPLYWTKIGARVYFASEIKALLRIPEVHKGRKVNEQSICQWLAYGRKDLNSATCFANIYSLPAASWVVVNRHFPDNIKTFWNVPEERLSERDLSTKEAAKTLRALLEDAVRIRLRADVPVSVELSGGMDSSTLVSLAAQVNPGKITTYTVRFPEKELNEEPFARSVARRVNTDYHILESPITNFWNQILSFTYLEEEPYHSPNLQTNQVIWAQMRAKGTKVSLNGAGGDETFAGYGQYFPLAQMQSLLEGRLPAYFWNALWYSSSRTRMKSLFGPVLRLIRESYRQQFEHPDFSQGFGYLKKEYRPTPTRNPLTLSEGLYGDMTNTLMPYWLRSGDRGYMGIPLEVRAPFLDYRIIEYAFRLPISYLIRDGWHKWILRKAVEDLLPKDVVWRRQKLGFPFPYERFYSANDEILGLIVNNSKNPYLDYSQRNRFSKDWKTLSFILWYELFFNENAPLFQMIETRARRMFPVENYGYAPQFLISGSWAR